MSFKISIFHKMLIAPLLAIMLFGLHITNIYIQQSESKKYMDLIYQKHLPILESANKNLILLDNIINVFDDAVAAGEEAWLDNNIINKTIVMNNFKNLEKLSDDKKKIENMKNIFNSYFNVSMKLSKLMLEETENWNEIETLTNYMMIYLKDTRLIFKNFQENQNEKLQNTIEITNEYGDKILQLGIVIGIISLVLIIVLTIFLSLSTKNSLKELVTSMRKISNGNPDFTKRLKKNSDDELGELVEEFNLFTKKLQMDHEELRVAKSEAETASKVKSEFVANMSHEIRTPLNAIIGFSELLNNTEVNHKQKSYLEAISSGGDTLLRIINDILDLSKIEAGKLEIQNEEVSLVPIINDIKAIFEQKAHSKNIDIQIKLDNNIPDFIIIDEIRLRQILLNIVGNAIKFTHEGGITISLFTSNIRESEFDLQIDVKDTGIGIPKEQQDKIFESFVQQDGQKNRQYGGTGLGLAICLKLIKMMNGSISLSSKEKEGSIFSIYLYNIQIAQHKKVITNTNTVSKIMFNKATLLIVDDVALNRKLIVESLQGFDIILIEASNGQEAIDLVKSENPDLILMDIKMPIMDGIEATKILKKDSKYNKIPIVALTASIRAREVENAAVLFSGYITKPLDINLLMKELKNFLPYTVSDIQVEDINSENILEIDEKVMIHFQKEFEKNIKEYWEKAAVGCSFEDILEFSNILNDFAKKYEQKNLIDFTNEVNIAIDNFDISTIEDLIEKFSNFLKECER